MSNTFFQFKQFRIQQDRCAMKVTTDACLFGAWVSKEVGSTRSEVRNVLDIGTGTGLLSLMLAQKTNFHIDTIEIDKDSFEQAKENIDASPWSNKINIFHDDIKKFQLQHQYDLIISNPPFYENELKSDDVKRNIALHGNELTLDQLLRVIDKNLSADGIFFLLLPYKRQEEVIKIFQKYELDLLKIIFVRQSMKHDYFRMMIKGKRSSEEIIETNFDEVSIWNDPSTSSGQQYSNRFVELLRDYYLNL